MKEKTNKRQSFTMDLASEKSIVISSGTNSDGIRIGQDAMKAAGAQPEFVAANLMQAQALNCSIILRAGDPPQYNKERSPKSGLNLSKTSKQGFFKGAIAEEVRFARLESGIPKPHHEKDGKHLDLEATNPEYQHVMQLDINMQDILREVGPEGDLSVLGFDAERGFLRLEYKKNKGPQEDLFKGQFVINLMDGVKKSVFYSREWDKPEHDKDWDPERKIIIKPPALKDVPADLYQNIFNDTFKLAYVDGHKMASFELAELKSANVFANRPRTEEDFKAAMGEEHPRFSLIKECTSLNEILDTLKSNLPPNEAKDIILTCYNKGGRIIAGDWDGMALGHPSSLKKEYTEVINVFDPQKSSENMSKLLDVSNRYLTDIKNAARNKEEAGEPLSAFDKQVISIEHMAQIVSDFALARAGCITAHEFVFQQVLNHAYRDKLNTHYGEEYDLKAVQSAMDQLIMSNTNEVDADQLIRTAKSLIDSEYTAHDSKPQRRMSDPMKEKLAEHMVAHLSLASENYVLPHLQHDENVHDLYQHGFDMRNPYGSNLEGAWLLLTPDGGIVYGETQEQLTDLLLCGDFLADNHIEVNHGADMSKGWGKVIKHQIELGQNIPEQTMEVYNDYVKSKELDNSIGITVQMKEQLAQFKVDNQPCNSEVQQSTDNTFNL